MLRSLFVNVELVARYLTFKLLSYKSLEPLGRKFLFIYGYLRFIWVHRRIPGDGSDNFNDFLFRVRVSGVLREPMRKMVTDKVLAKDYIAMRLGINYTVPTVAVLDTDEAVKNYQPKFFPFVLKPSHSSGRIIIINNSSEYNENLRYVLAWLNHDYFFSSLEENYRGLVGRVLVEPFISSEFYLEGSIHCLQGIPKIITLIDRFSPTKSRESFNVNFQALNVALGCPYQPFVIDRPVFWQDLLNASTKIAREFAYIRIDFYASHDAFLIGELTNLPAGSYGRFSSLDGAERFSAAFLN